MSTSHVFATSLPVNIQDANNIINSSKNIDVTPIKIKEQKAIYISKKDKEGNIIGFERKVSNGSKNRDNKLKENDRIISSASRNLSALYPEDNNIANNSFPGYRGPNQLVVYQRGFGRTTQTNEFGKEAVVINGIVTNLTGANSVIPKDGFVVSGHGVGKKWINDNLKIGTKVEIADRTIKAYTTIDSYRYFAKSKIDNVESILISTKSDYQNRDDKFIYYYLKRAKNQYKKSLKDNTDVSLACAKEAINSASLAFRYTLPFLKDELKGVWIRPSEININDIQKTLDKIKDTGINNVFLETYFHGKTIFPSKTMREYGFIEQNEKFAGIDPLAIWIKEAHKREIKVHCWFESFYVGNTSPSLNPNSILAKKPNWQNKTKQKADYQGFVSHPQEHNGYFLDPANPEVTAFLLKLIGEISARYNIDGLNIDYVRYPNISKENLSNQWGYTPYAREEFKKTYEVDPIEISPKNSLWNDWCEYRTDKITIYIKRASELVKNRDILFSAVIFPDYKVSLSTKFQNWPYWVSHKYLDAITPLILTGDDDLAKSMLEEIKKKTPNDVMIYPGLFAGFIESDPEDLLKQIHIIRKLRLNGIILFDWAHLNDKYLDVLKTSVFKTGY